MNQESITILTGAGVSAESGIPTFRGHEGLWENHRIEDVATPEAFRKNPQLVHQFYNERRKRLLSGEVHPNPAHYAICELEKNFSGNVWLITQNIDNLHELAGSKKVIHMHGELLKSCCLYCGTVQNCERDLSIEDTCPHCKRKGGMRPHIVWFGEIPLHMETIELKLSQTTTFIAIGTSGIVYPAAGFALTAKQWGAKTIEVNTNPSEISPLFDQVLIDKASIAVPKLVKELLYKK